MEGDFFVSQAAIEGQLVIGVLTEGSGLEACAEDGVCRMDVETGAFYAEIAGEGSVLNAILQDAAEIEGFCLQGEVVDCTGGRAEVAGRALQENSAGGSVKGEIGGE